MTAHELARKLLEGPDIEVQVYNDFTSGLETVHEVEVRGDTAAQMLNSFRKPKDHVLVKEVVVIR
jgi:hypothetical protein